MDNRAPQAASAAPQRVQRRRRRSRGQSLVEFSIVLPVFLAIVGVVIDASRLYQSWINLESATRDAAQYLARSATDPFSVDYTYQGVDSDTKAIYVVGQATGAAFARSQNATTMAACANAQLTTTYAQNTATAVGGTVTNPLGSATVTACLPFRTLFAYPFLTNNGVFTLRSQRTMTFLVGR